MVFSLPRLLFLWRCLLLTAASGSIVLTPPKVVVEFGAPASAVCSTNLTIFGMGWESPLDPVDMTEDVTSLPWKTSSVTEWDIKTHCYVNMKTGEQKKETLIVVIYKRPDSVSISRMSASVPMTEGNKYDLQCRIQNVAPVGNLVVKWYKGQTAVKRDSFTDSTITPENKTVNLSIQPSRNDNGAVYRCEAQLELGPEGPRTPPTVASNPLPLNVLYKPTFSSDVGTFNQSNDKITLNCTVSGNPPPSYTWDHAPEGQPLNQGIIVVPPRTVDSYNCTASNSEGSALKQFIIKPEPQSRDLTLLWIFLGILLLLVILGTVGFLVYKRRKNQTI